VSSSSSSSHLLAATCRYPPALIFMYLGTGAAAVPPAAAVSKLASTVLVPVVVGMSIRALPWAGGALGSKATTRGLKRTSDVIILAIVYTTFCNTFSSGFGVPAGEVAALALVLGVLLVAYKTAIFVAARAAGLSNIDTVAAVFVGSQKTLAFGLPLIKALFEVGRDGMRGTTMIESVECRV
jgi:sodium/bile acid cotransporter 7